MRVLGLDFGEKRVGYAVGDTENRIAFGRDFLVYEDSRELIRLVSEICRRENIEKIILGLPLMQEGGEAEITEKVKVFGSKLKEDLKLPIEYQDERFSSKEAGRILQTQEIKAKDQKGKKDVLAAQLILQSWLDSQSE
ncbi:MAG TPA: Holliday junction resolvase RuvX [Candidatus Peregrinibacteria bacterium]|nr:Holliday junction resolvase RuvX [Candidatus Peregrinibacteria bacterium]